MKWYIGQEIVCIKTHSLRKIKKGQIFTIKGLQTSPCKCKSISIDVGVASYGLFECTDCGFLGQTPINIYWFHEVLFAPLDYDISELTDILEKPFEHGVDKLRELANNLFETL